jgi:hypothetical protein
MRRSNHVSLARVFAILERGDSTPNPYAKARRTRDWSVLDLDLNSKPVRRSLHVQSQRLSFSMLASLTAP